MATAGVDTLVLVAFVDDVVGTMACVSGGDCVLSTACVAVFACVGVLVAFVDNVISTACVGVLV